jgi:DNA-binding NarL/FixJ family response regulator
LRALLDTAPDLEVVGEASDGAEAIKLAERLDPDVVLMDLRMPGMDGVAATAALRARAPRARVLVLTTFDDDVSVFQAIAAGACGYLLKDTPRANLFEGVRAAAAGHSPLEPSVASRLVAQVAGMAARGTASLAALAGVSERELDVLRLLARGSSNKEIASALRITEGTVKNHLTSVFEKLGVTDRTQAALRARELGIS